MDHTDNYAVQARQARQRFCSYDQEAIIRKLRLHIHRRSRSEGSRGNDVYC